MEWSSFIDRYETRAAAIEDETDIFGYIQRLGEKKPTVSELIVSFLKRHHVYTYESRWWTRRRLCFLAPKIHFRTNYLEGSEHLLLLKDKTEEIKTICHCSRKADHEAWALKRANLSMMRTNPNWYTRLYLGLPQQFWSRYTNWKRLECFREW